MLTPYNNNESGKKEQVALMFNNIARRYDFLNHFLSLGIDKIWRKKAVNTLKGISPNSTLLDVATGTGDLAIVSLKHKPKQIVGIDISEDWPGAAKFEFTLSLGLACIILNNAPV